MKKPTLVPTVLLSLLGTALFLSPARSADPTSYRGFTIDDSHLSRATNLDAIDAAIRAQIDIVWSVGVPAEMLKFFQSVPFELVPPGAIMPGNPGLYSNRTRSIQITAIIVNIGHKPVLLHELLHAYHDQRIPHGFGNSTIDQFYRTAKAQNLFVARSHMMANNKEYFACAGTTFLFGVTAQEPFQREKVKTQQPELYDFLQKLFGPTTGSYVGSLTNG